MNRIAERTRVRPIRRCAPQGRLHKSLIVAMEMRI